VPGGHNGLTEVGSDVAARANVTCTRPVPCPFVGHGYAVNDQALFARILAKYFANTSAKKASRAFATGLAGITGNRPGKTPIPEPLLVPGMKIAGTIPPPSWDGISEQPE